ncbi:hypothetical protein F4861DRAFT_479608 [Xylaria intraflava]|nr:hypothetical protein F4861DRAFT_479608 [Xylaria intraflava]
MAQAIKSALPSHLKPQLAGRDSDDEFSGRHHGKTRSHMVSATDACAASATHSIDCFSLSLSASLVSALHSALFHLFVVPRLETTQVPSAASCSVVLGCPQLASIVVPEGSEVLSDGPNNTLSDGVLFAPSPTGKP